MTASSYFEFVQQISVAKLTEYDFGMMLVPPFYYVDIKRFYAILSFVVFKYIPNFFASGFNSVRAFDFYYKIDFAVDELKNVFETGYGIFGSVKLVIFEF